MEADPAAAADGTSFLILLVVLAIAAVIYTAGYIHDARADLNHTSARIRKGRP